MKFVLFFPATSFGPKLDLWLALHHNYKVMHLDHRMERHHNHHRWSSQSWLSADQKKILSANNSCQLAGVFFLYVLVQLKQEDLLQPRFKSSLARRVPYFTFTPVIVTMIHNINKMERHRFYTL
jgi:hypothetical protein